MKDKKRRKGGIGEEGSPRMFICGEEGCDYESKRKDGLKKHKAAEHDIDVTYYLCNVNGCEYKAKEASKLKRHKAIIHDIDATYYFAVWMDVSTRLRKPVVLRSIKLMFMIST